MCGACASACLGGGDRSHESGLTSCGARGAGRSVCLGITCRSNGAIESDATAIDSRNKHN